MTDQADTTGFTDTQSRYIAYAKLHEAKSTQTMIKTDRKRWPGGSMCGFICWINDAWRTWCELNEVDMNYPKTETVHNMFDDWLPEYQEKVTGGRFEI